jgi:hypothetical protein
MKFSIIASALIAVAAAQYGTPAEESCSAVVTVTVTEYVGAAMASLYITF